MKNISSLSDSCIYPGIYVPLTREKEILRELKHLKKENVVHPPISISELSDSFKLEMFIPGMKRENIIIDASDLRVFIYGTHREPEDFQKNADQIGSFKWEGFGSHFKLPKNADIEFASAEYKSGMLSIHFHKTHKPTKKLHTHLVVY